MLKVEAEAHSEVNIVGMMKMIVVMMTSILSSTAPVLKLISFLF